MMERERRCRAQQARRAREYSEQMGDVNVSIKAVLKAGAVRDPVVSAKRSLARKAWWKRKREASAAKLIEGRAIDWSKRDWFPGRCKGLVPVKILVLRAVAPDRWIAGRDILKALPSEDFSKVTILTRRGWLERRPLSRPPGQRKAYEYRLARLGELALAQWAKQNPGK